MKLTVLIENSGPEGLVHEHGLALYIQYKGHTILLDGGQTGESIQNVRTLGLDLGAVEAVVLSHGHFDHANGLPALLEEITAPVYLRPKALEDQYMGDWYVGLDDKAKEVLGARAKLVEDTTEILPGVWVVPDRVDHEQSLVFETSRGLVACNSCCHAGAGYIVKDLMEAFPGKKVTALVGGMHLMGKEGLHTLGVEPGIVKNLGTWLFDELDVDEVYTGHCTGLAAYDILAEGHPDRMRPLSTGLVIELAD